MGSKISRRSSSIELYTDSVGLRPLRPITAAEIKNLGIAYQNVFAEFLQSEPQLDKNINKAAILAEDIHLLSIRLHTTSDNKILISIHHLCSIFIDLTHILIKEVNFVSDRPSTDPRISDIESLQRVVSHIKSQLESSLFEIDDPNLPSIPTSQILEPL